MTTEPAVATGEPLAVPRESIRATANTMSVNDETVRAIAAPVVAHELRRLAAVLFETYGDDISPARMRDAMRTRAAEVDRSQGGDKA